MKTGGEKDPSWYAWRMARAPRRFPPPIAASFPVAGGKLERRPRPTDLMRGDGLVRDASGRAFFLPWPRFGLAVSVDDPRALAAAMAASPRPPLIDPRRLAGTLALIGLSAWAAEQATTSAAGGFGGCVWVAGLAAFSFADTPASHIWRLAGAQTFLALAALSSATTAKGWAGLWQIATYASFHLGETWWRAIARRRRGLRALAGADRFSLSGEQMLEIRAAKMSWPVLGVAVTWWLWAAGLVGAALAAGHGDRARLGAQLAAALMGAGLALDASLWGGAWRRRARAGRARPGGGLLAGGAAGLWAPRLTSAVQVGVVPLAALLALLALAVDLGDRPRALAHRQVVAAEAQQAEMVWLDPGWRQDVRLRVLRALCRPTPAGGRVAVDLQLINLGGEAASLPLTFALRGGEARRDGDVVIAPAAAPAVAETWTLAAGGPPTARQLRFEAPAGGCAAGPRLLCLAAGAGAPTYVALQPTSVAELEANPVDLPWEEGSAAAAAGRPPAAARDLHLSVLRRRGRGCLWQRQAADGSHQDLAFVDRPCHRLAIALDAAGAHAVLSRAESLEVLGLHGGAPVTLVNPIDTADATTLAAFDAHDTLLAHVLERPLPPRPATSSLFARDGDGWRLINGPASAMGGPWAALAQPMARLAGGAVVHAGLGEPGEPQLTAGAAGAWRPPRRDEVARLPAARRPRAGAWGLRAGSAPAATVGLDVDPASAAQPAAPAALAAWRGEAAADSEAVTAPVVWLAGETARVLVDLPPYGAPPALSVALQGPMALIGGRAVRGHDGALEATVPFVRVDMRTGEVLETFDDEVADVAFWPWPLAAGRRQRPPSGRPAGPRPGRR